MTDTPAIEADGLIKHYGKTKALDGFDLTVPTGTVYGLLGPNGAGKTTAVRVLATLLRPDGGKARVLGHDVTTEAATVRRTIGLTGQYAALDEYLTGRANLVMIGQLSRLTAKAAKARADDLLEQFDLTAAANRAVKTYSGGMRRRLDLAASLIGRPSVLFLDEPTTGLDPSARALMWDIVRPLLGGLRGQAAELADHDKVGPPGEVLVKRGVLAGEPDRPADGGGLGHHVVAEDAGLAGVWAQQRGQHADGGGLARAVGAEQAVDGVGRHGEVEPVQRLGLAVVLDQSVRLDGGFITHSVSWHPRGGALVISYDVLFQYAVR
jgi:ABC-type Na+ transport system ATPase subunit NatA